MAPHKETNDKADRAAETAREGARQAAEDAARTARTVTNEAAEAGQHAARAGADIAQSQAETVQQIVQSGLSLATQAAERSVDQFAEVFGFSGERAEEAARQSSRNIEAIAECSTVLAQGLQDISRQWLDWAQDRVQQQIEGATALLRCRSPQDLFAVQSDLLRGNLELFLDSSRRIAERSVQLTEEAARKVTAEAENATARTRRAAEQARRAA